jgi:hypothetical protein
MGNIEHLAQSDEIRRWKERDTEGRPRFSTERSMSLVEVNEEVNGVQTPKTSLRQKSTDCPLSTYHQRH